MDEIARALLALLRAPPPGAAVGFALFDERLRCVAASDSLADVLGRHAAALEPILRDVLATGRPRLGVELGGSDPGEHTWLGSYYPLRDGGSVAIGAIAVEITAPKRAEQALRESRGRLEEAQRLACMGAWTWHVDEQRTEWSDELFGIYGFPGPVAPSIETLIELIVEEDRPVLRAARARLLAEGAPFDVHFRFRRPDGRVVHIRSAATAVQDAAGRVTLLKGFAQDVTELRRGEEQQAAVARLGQFALGGAVLEELFHRAVASVADVMLVEQALLTERLPDGRFVIRAARGWPPGAIGSVGPDTAQSGYTLRVAGPVVVEQWAAEQRFGSTPLLRDAGIASSASVPVGGPDAAFGVLAVHSPFPQHFTADDVVFLQSVANVLAAAIEARRSRERIDALAAARQRLVAQALDAEERTRRVIAEALHDGVLQEALVLRHTVGRLIGGGEEEAERARSAIERMAKQLREAMVALHPTVLQVGGLAPALKAVADQQARLGGFSADVDVEPEAAGVRDQLILSIARELLVNAAKHARAREVHVRVRRAADGIELEVADDGAGISEERLRAALAEGHIGLASSAERVEAVGGRLVIGGGPGQGTVATAMLPG